MYIPPRSLIIVVNGSFIMVKDFYQASIVGYCHVTNHTRTQGLELSPIYYLYESWVGWTDLLICSGGTMAHSCICDQLQVG